MKTFHLAIDLGATSGRVILGEFNGSKVEMRELSRFKYPMLPINGHLYWNLPYIYWEILEGLKKCGNVLRESGCDNAKLSSIGIDTWGVDVAYFHKDGSLSSLPYCYRDAHTENAIEKFCGKMPRDMIYKKTGIQFMNFNTLFQLFTIKENSPEVIEAAHRILFIPDALSFMLTGNAVTEYTIASTSQILNPKSGDLDEDILKTLGIPREKFGPIVYPGDVIGKLSSQVMDFTGLGDVPVIAVAGHDTASAVIGVPSPDKDFAYLSCGTWSLLGIETPEAIINDKSREYNFTNEGGIDGTTRFLKNICGLWLFEKCREEFKDVPSDIGELSLLCTASNCNSIINPDDPSFSHPESMTRAIEEFCKKTQQQIPEVPADFIRVVYRSLAKRYKTVIEWLKQLSPIEIKRLHVIGGGSQNQYMMQLTADETGLPVIAGPAESTALGNLLVQLKATGTLKNLAEMRKVAINSTETKTYIPDEII